MALAADRPLRADAARNAERILRAARVAYAELGPDVPMDVIARRAGVGERTLYRRFPTKGELARAVIDESIAEHLTPVIERACRYRDPLRGLTELIEAAIALGAREHHVLAAALKAGTLTDVSVRLDDALEDLTTRAQQAGLVRADLVPADLPRVIAMLNGVLTTMDPASDGWRRYVHLILDAMTTRTPRRLPPAAALQYQPRVEDWPR
ncbi:helix-turn-helix domain-containing protein [Mycobacterium sp. B14F4]|uniref:TetR/AcrR family transcriptional regulator n=1 Tax=Mycobacterium sp. B14F4 TaxID=3153565 RepID=UPI00325C5146